ncbi:MAG: hypothetical protein ACLFU9_03225 [Candidatus Bathyarchaeia archaeon]
MEYYKCRRKRAVLMVGTILITFVLLLTIGGTMIAANESSLDYEYEKQLSLKFVDEVMGINLSNYTIDFSILRPGEDVEVDVQLSSGEGNATICVLLQRGKISWVYHRPRTPPSWLWAGEVKESLGAVKETLTRYQSHFDVSTTQFIQVLDEAEPNQNQTISYGNLTLEVKNNGRHFNWIYVVEGMEVYNTLSIQVSEDGHLTNFISKLGIWSVGSTKINISEENAKSIALPYAQEYANEHGRTIKSVDATVRYNQDIWSERADRYTFYPFWTISIEFEQPHNWTGTGISGYHVSIWADTGKVYYAHPQALWSSEPNQPNYSPLAIIAVLMAPAIITSYIVYRKRSKKAEA